MVRNRRLAKHILDAGWGQFVQMLAYKGAWYGCELAAADRWHPSSKTFGFAELTALPLAMPRPARPVVLKWSLCRCMYVSGTVQNAKQHMTEM